MSDLGLVAAAALMGLAGTPHCAAMCGGSSLASAAGARWAWHAGRIAGYALAGAAVAGGVAGLSQMQSAAPWLRPLWTLLHLGCIAFGASMLVRGRLPTALAGLPAPAVFVAPIRFVRRMPAGARAGVAGLCWAALPCGLLQSALLVAALGQGPAGGGLVMAAFAIASVPGLALPAMAWSRLGRGGNAERRAAIAVRLAGAMLAAGSAFALWRGLSAGGAWCAA